MGQNDLKTTFGTARSGWLNNIAVISKLHLRNKRESGSNTLWII